MKRVQLIGLTLGALALAGVTSACGNATAGTAQPAPSSSAAAEKKDIKVADVLKVPEGNKLVGEYEASGVQAYTCAAGTWKLLEPAAVLVDKDSKPVMLHSRGPVWVSTVDGSAVEAGAVDGAKVDRQGAIPELLLKAKAVRGDGLLGGVTYVQRLNTEGGVAPTGACQANAQVSVPYTALYAFYESV
ncbi:DUF3455 domain-containing protein [Umezawaea endophytica]|uniref:DUF3455 domain-containing protein n=1 Tax=Umezawaea endophytica TaxID=1654476 RepID=A0A9X2VW17_9PSEU|nr:DUF3455 domain-containing protein [Umezawaea endophytica]MCS7483671.1 DUF3455 domain-containing protein [Umezawaea endophytica]